MNLNVYRIILPVLLLFILSGLYADDATSDEEWKKQNQTFYLSILSKELLNSDFYSLQQRAMSLGLEEMDSADKYRKAIADYYGIKVFSEPAYQGDKIILERAGELKMIKLNEVNEENLHILGKARIIINGKDEENKATKREIEADEMYIDLKNKEISGIGNVYYSDDKLEFRGEQFYFNYKLNKGTLLSGKTKIKQKDKSGLEGAFFTGERITYLGNDESILYNGKLTTCEEDDPHYYINVSRLWLNKDSEWGLLNGVVHVGPIPFLYFPVYYHPKNIDIYPSLGYRTREGWYIQTTYSILGSIDTGSTTADSSATDDFGVSNRRKAPSSNEVFAITKNEVDKFLNKYYDASPFYKKHPELRILPDFKELDFSFKIFADAYTNLGFYYGGAFYFKMDHQRFPVELSILTDYGFSRRIWEDTETDQYLPYNPSDKTAALTDDNTENMKNTYFNPFANPLELRTSQYMKLSGELFKNVMNLKYTAQIEYASDTSFYEDFYNRSLTFSYIDLLADTLQYSIESKDKGSSIFTTDDDDDSVGTESTLNNYISFTLTPTSIPDILGLKLVSSASLDVSTGLNLTSQEVEEYQESEVDGAEDPKAERYFFDNVEVPTMTAKLSGRVLDYEVFTQMADKYKEYKGKKNTPAVNNDTKELDYLYYNMNVVNNIDQTSDTTVLDYKYLLPFFATKIKDTGMAGADLTGYYDEILTTDQYSPVGAKTEKSATTKTVKEYSEVVGVDKAANKTNSEIQVVSFSLDYSVNEVMQNKFLFYLKADRYRDDYDNMMEFMSGHFDFNDRLMRFNIANKLSTTISGSLAFIKFSNAPGALLGFSPKFTFSHQEDWDDMDIYDHYLDVRTDSDDDEDAEDRLAILIDNRENTEYSLNYSDTITNDLSFGSYFIKGTGVSSNFSVDMYDYNEQESSNFQLLNEINKKLETPNYESVDYTNYFARRGFYGMAKDWYSQFTLKFNFLPETSKHSLSLSAGQKINYMIPSSTLTTLKSDLWDEEEDSVKYLWDDAEAVLRDSKETEVDLIEDQAQEYIYYRTNGRNLNDKIKEFFYAENFWSGQKNFRTIFENFSLKNSYSYKDNNITIFSLDNTITFKLTNIGVFSNGKGGLNSFAIYPDDAFGMTLFNSMLTYDMSLVFTKKYDKNILSSSSDSRAEYDEYNIMTYVNTHTVNFKLSGTLFDFQLPKSDWMSFKSVTVFDYNRNIEWQTPGDDERRQLYLDSQTFTLNILMDIFSFKVVFKSFDYVDGGYAVALNNGTITVGHDITEIPVLLNVLKLRFKPTISYVFTPNQKSYYDDGTLYESSSDYYEDNSIEFAFEFEAILGENKDYETTIKFGSMSNNTKLYQYYEQNSSISFGEDLLKSFNFSSEEDRRESNFNLQKITFSVEHKLHDWNLYFEYLGSPEKDYTGKKYIWDNTFTFKISWNLDSKNQLMKLFNKTKVDNEYEEGEWKQPSMSLDPDES